MHETSIKSFVVTFVDFQKTYDSIDRTSLFNSFPPGVGFIKENYY